MTFAIGLDRGGAVHATCVIDRFEARQDADGLRDMERRQARLGAAGDLPVAVERPRGVIVGALDAAGHPVVATHPNADKPLGPRYRANDAKDDRGDAYLRIDGHRFRPLTPPSDAVRALRALLRGRNELVATPLAGFLAQHRYSGWHSPEESLARLRAARQGLAVSAKAEAMGEVVRVPVAVSGPIVTGIIDLTARIRHDTAASEDCRILMSFPCVRHLTPVQLVADTGLALVTCLSGQSRCVSFRWA